MTIELVERDNCHVHFIDEDIGHHSNKAIHHKLVQHISGRANIQIQKKRILYLL